MKKMTAGERQAQILAIAAEKFAVGGLHDTSTEAIARRVGITQAYVFRLFGSMKSLFAKRYRRPLSGSPTACGPQPRKPRGARGRSRELRAWHSVADTMGLDPVTVKSFLFTHITSETDR
jgi:hypothetical protein